MDCCDSIYTINYRNNMGVKMSKEKDYRLDDLISAACDTLDAESEDYDEEAEAVHEIADGAVPIYYWDIAQYAAYNNWLMTVKPEAYSDGNAHDQIQANIYEAICEGLHKHIQEKRDRADERNKKIVKGETNEK